MTTRHIEDPTGDLRADMLVRLEYDLMPDARRRDIRYVPWDRDPAPVPPFKAPSFETFDLPDGSRFFFPHDGTLTVEELPPGFVPIGYIQED